MQSGAVAWLRLDVEGELTVLFMPERNDCLVYTLQQRALLLGERSFMSSGFPFSSWCWPFLLVILSQTDPATSILFRWAFLHVDRFPCCAVVIHECTLVLSSYLPLLQCIGNATRSSTNIFDHNFKTRRRRRARWTRPGTPAAPPARRRTTCRRRRARSAPRSCKTARTTARGWAIRAPSRAVQSACRR